MPCIFLLAEFHVPPCPSPLPGFVCCACCAWPSCKTRPGDDESHPPEFSVYQICGGLHGHGVSQNGWCIVEDPINTNDDWGYPHDSGNLHVGILYYPLLNNGFWGLLSGGMILWRVVIRWFSEGGITCCRWKTLVRSLYSFHLWSHTLPAGGLICMSASPVTPLISNTPIVWSQILGL